MEKATAEMQALKELHANENALRADAEAEMIAQREQMVIEMASAVEQALNEKHDHDNAA